jgi:predicted secreted Zn-dependent protease
MKKILLTVVAVASLSLPAAAAGLSRTYSYFSVGGYDCASRPGPQFVALQAGWRV